MVKTFLDFLIKKGLLDSSKIVVLKKEKISSDARLQDVLLKKKMIKEDDLFKAKAEFLGLSIVTFGDVSSFSREVLAEIPEESASHYKIIPLKKTDNLLEVGMVNPEDANAREAIKFISSQRHLKIKVSVISLHGFNKLLGRYRTFKGEVEAAVEEIKKELAKEDSASQKKVEEAGDEKSKVISEAPISKIVAVIIKHATEERASDIHVEPMEQNVRVRFRVDGVLKNNLVLPLSLHSAIISRIKIISSLKIDETRIPQDGRFSASVGSKKIDFRVSTFPTVGGEKVVMRILDPSVGFLSLDDIGIEGRNLELIQQEIKQPFGMILISGPTGSGKSTTLYSILNILNKDGVNIVSLEDPVEYYVDGVNQSQIKAEIGYDFASGLRHILRQDPNVIMVGEIRDGETAELAVHAALTGHIVLSTIHTNNAMGVIPRLMDMGVDSFLIPPSISLSVAQRLIRRLCPSCREETKASLAVMEMIEGEIKKIPDSMQKEIKRPLKLYKSEGCKLCVNGTKGRVAIFEMLSMTKGLEEIVVKDLTDSNIRIEAKEQGMVTMKQDGILKALRGIVGIEEVLRVTED